MCLNVWVASSALEGEVWQAHRVVPQKDLKHKVNPNGHNHERYVTQRRVQSFCDCHAVVPSRRMRGGEGHSVSTCSAGLSGAPADHPRGSMMSAMQVQYIRMQQALPDEKLGGHRWRSLGSLLTCRPHLPHALRNVVLGSAQGR